MLELLAAVCLVRGGHDIILSAFDNFKEVGVFLILCVCVCVCVCLSMTCFHITLCLATANSFTVFLGPDSPYLGTHPLHDTSYVFHARVWVWVEFEPFRQPSLNGGIFSAMLTAV